MTRLASYASNPILSRGRRYEESVDNMRNAFQRDRDRIIHCSAFRRLEYKTQVFVNHEGDLFRNRLTHSLEVAQLSRSVARVLCLSEDLSEAIALAHDLGHTPFGHAGQDVLNQLVRQHAPNIGGFEHNLQSLRIVDELEQRYANFNGLNLTFETRSGLLKHCSRENAEQLGQVAFRFLKGEKPALEAQLVNVADELAYNHHDIDDGLRSGLLTIDQMCEVSVFYEYHEIVRKAYPYIKGRRLISEVIRRMIHAFVSDLTTQTQLRIREMGVETLEDVYQSPWIVGYSPLMKEKSLEVKRFLMKHLYRHPQVMRMTYKTQKIIEDLFYAFLEHPDILPLEYQAPEQSSDLQVRLITDYISGMTDRFAFKEHQTLFGDCMISSL